MNCQRRCLRRCAKASASRKPIATRSSERVAFCAGDDGSAEELGAIWEEAVELKVRVACAVPLAGSVKDESVQEIFSVNCTPQV